MFIHTVKEKGHILVQRGDFESIGSPWALVLETEIG